MRHADQKISDVMVIIRQTLKAKGISQEQFSRDLQISLATAKRWLSGRGVSLESLFKVLDYLDLSLANIAKLIEDKKAKSFQYTKEKEEFFVLNPSSLAYFDHLLKGKTPKQIARKFKLDHRCQRRHLSFLDKLGLIEVHAGDKVKVLMTGEPEWRKNGPLAKAFKQNLLEGFMKRYGNKSLISIYNLTKKDIRKIKESYNSILETARSSEKISFASGEKTEQACLIFAAEHFEPSFLANVIDI